MSFFDFLLFVELPIFLTFFAVVFWLGRKKA